MAEVASQVAAEQECADEATEETSLIESEKVDLLATERDKAASSGVISFQALSKETDEEADNFKDVIKSQPKSINEDSVTDSLLGRKRSWSTGLFEKEDNEVDVIKDDTIEFEDILKAVPIEPVESCCLSYKVCCLRTAMRKLFHIQGTTCGDACVSCWCTSRAIAQMKREAVARASLGLLQ